MTNILIVDDDTELTAALSEYLTGHHYSVIECHDSSKAIEVLQNNTVNLILLDMLMPNISGLTLSKLIREITMTPIIMLTGVTDDIEQIVSLEGWVDDYETKPFDLRLLLSKIRALLRRCATDSYDINTNQEASIQQKNISRPQVGYQFSGWFLNTDTHQLTCAKGNEAVLSTAEYNLLLALIERPKRILSRDYLLELTDTGRDAFDRSIDVIISRLRNKLKMRPQAEPLIQTIRSVGYMFCTNVLKQGIEES